jgi:hypothetical protein
LSLYGKCGLLPANIQTRGQSGLRGRDYMSTNEQEVPEPPAEQPPKKKEMRPRA